MFQSLLKLIQPYLNLILGGIIVALLTLSGVLGWYSYHLRGKLDTAQGQIQIVNHVSEVQKIKTVQIEKRIPVIRTQIKENLQIVKEYVYDNNKSECCNAIDSMRRVFTGVRTEDGVLTMSGGETNSSSTEGLQSTSSDEVQ